MEKQTADISGKGAVVYLSI